MRIAIMAASLLVAAVGVVVAAAFLCLALYDVLLLWLLPPLAALCAASIIFVLSLLVIFLGQALARAVAARARARRAKHNTASAISAELGRLFGEDAQAFINDKPILSLLVALIGGFAVGANPKLRAILNAILKT